LTQPETPPTQPQSSQNLTETLPEPSKPSSDHARAGGKDYWLTHKYFRLDVEHFVDQFCGWKPLKQLIEYAAPGRNRAFLCALFVTGGRVTEVLELQASNFIIDKQRGSMLIRGMKLEKRYKKTSGYVDEEGKQRWNTKPTVATRKPFPIMLKEPLVQILLDYMGDREGYLFPSPHIRRAGKPLTRSWAYKEIIHIDSILPEELRESLGLDQPFIKEGVKIADEIHLWLHWFRSQRASQLVEDYGYELMDLLNWFSWEDEKTALRYAKKGWRGLLNKMQNVEVRYG